MDWIVELSDVPVNCVQLSMRRRGEERHQAVNVGEPMSREDAGITATWLEDALNDIGWTFTMRYLSDLIDTIHDAQRI